MLVSRMPWRPSLKQSSHHWLRKEKRERERERKRRGGKRRKEKKKRGKGRRTTQQLSSYGQLVPHHTKGTHCFSFHAILSHHLMAGRLILPINTHFPLLSPANSPVSPVEKKNLHFTEKFSHPVCSCTTLCNCNVIHPSDSGFTWPQK